VNQLAGQDRRRFARGQFDHGGDFGSQDRVNVPQVAHVSEPEFSIVDLPHGDRPGAVAGQEPVAEYDANVPVRTIQLADRSERLSVPIYIIDAFADQPFGGNPAAVCPLDRPADDGWMQQVAGEMNLSETAFLVPEADGWRLRWFTPAVEVDLCGHATLASAHVLWETGRLTATATARFHTNSGLLTATRNGDTIVLDFPAAAVDECTPPDGLLDALGVESRFVGRNRMDVLIELASESAVRGVCPDFSRLAAVPVRGVIVTAQSDDPAYEFVSRFFAPASGVPEDPVTGSAHCALGPFWAERLGKSNLVGRQVSKRGGVIRVGVRGDRVMLGGRAVTVLRGELLV
jgi:PhzF family phenazine biosynthesis protein